MSVERNLTKRHSPLLDGLRVFAVVLVLSEHLRSAFFVPFETLSGARALLFAPFYIATTLGHQAVLIFFALSGFLVGGSVLSQLAGGHFSTRNYVLRRMTRLWIVLLPALGFTLLVDSAIQVLAGPQVLDGTFGSIASLPVQGAPANHSVLTFLGNAFFLQGIFVPIFGSNGPLWSLAYEFWYYVMFPLAAFAIIYRGAPMTAHLGALAAVLLFAFMLPWNLIANGSVWLLGALVTTSLGDRLPFKSSTFWAPIVASIILVVLLFLTEIDKVPGGSISFGLYVALCLPYLSKVVTIGNKMRSVLSFGAEISYSIYLFHFGLVVAFGAAFGYDQRFTPTIVTVGSFLLIAASILCLCTAFWYLFERHTNRVYQWLEKPKQERNVTLRVSPAAYVAAAQKDNGKQNQS